MKRTLSGGVVLLCLAAPLFAEKADQTKATIAYLQKLQNKDGGFRPNAAAEASSLRATSSALRALKYFGGEAPDKAAAIEFVKKCYDKDSGGFADTPGGKPEITATAVGLMALVELKVPTAPYEAGALKYFETNVKMFEDIRIAAAGLEAVGRKPEDKTLTTWIMSASLHFGRHASHDISARGAGGAAVTLMRLGVSLGESDRTDALKAMVQNADGAFAKDKGGSDLESTYRVMRCFHMLKKQPGDPARLRAFVADCRNTDGGYGNAPKEKSAASSTYFAAIILHWLDEK